MADQVLVSNVSGRLVTLVLAGKHLASAPKGAPHRYKPVKLVTVHHAKDGQLAMRSRKVEMADSIRIPAGGQVAVDRSAMHCPEFKKAVKAKRIKVVKDPYTPPTPAPAAESDDKPPTPAPAAESDDKPPTPAPAAESDDKPKPAAPKKATLSPPAPPAAGTSDSK